MIDSNDVKAKLCKLKMNKAPGIGSVGSRMLLAIVDEISLLLNFLINHRKQGMFQKNGNWQMSHPYLERVKEVALLVTDL